MPANKKIREYIRAEVDDIRRFKTKKTAKVALDMPDKKRTAAYTAKGCPCRKTGGLKYNQGIGNQNNRVNSPNRYDFLIVTTELCTFLSPLCR